MASIPRFMPSEKRSKLKYLKLLILTAFSSEYMHYNGDNSIVFEALPASVLI
jgi:hypothetical protein